MAVVRKKQDDKYLKELRELVTSGAGNRQCFDCGQKGPTYVNMTIGSFVCTRCSGMLRGLTPPHRVKSISMATFSQEELDFLKTHGNDECAKTWLGLWDPKRAVHQDQRELMVDKYERKRYYLEPASPLKSLTNAVSLKSNVSTSSSAGSESFANATHSGNMENGFAQVRLTPPSRQHSNTNSLRAANNYLNDMNRPQQQDKTFGVDFTPTNIFTGSTTNSQVSSRCTQQKGSGSLSNGFTTDSYMADDPSNSSVFNEYPQTKCLAEVYASYGPTLNGYLANNVFTTSDRIVNNNTGTHNATILNMQGNGYAKIQPKTADANGRLSNGNHCIRNNIGNGCSNGSNDTFDANNYSGYSSNKGLKSVSFTDRYNNDSFCQCKTTSSKTFGNFGRDPFCSVCSRKIIENFADFEGAPVFICNAENFADFDHAPIHNPQPSGLPIPINGIKNGSKSASANGSNNNHNNNNNSSNNHNNNNNNSNNKLSSTPSEDRYAALKDLDEQLRESKAAAAAAVATTTVVDSFGNAVNSSNNNHFNGGSVNPFKSQQQQQQLQLQQQQQQQQPNGTSTVANAMINPFQGTQGTPAQNLFGQLTVISNGNGMLASGFASPSQQQQANPAAFYNGFNGATAGSAAVMYPPTTLLATGPNGCGFGFGAMQQQIAATGGGAFNNPFAATGTLNSNNPFL